jgi:hypothetical protein
MIRLVKGVEPLTLSANAVTWTAEILAALAGDPQAAAKAWRRRSTTEIKSAVRRDSHDKCIYCESKIMHISFGDVEHIQPKARFPAQTFAWDNLGLVCSKCNNAKRDAYELATPPINPFDDDPTQFFDACGPWVWAKPANDRALVTESLVKLNRAELMEARTRRIKTVRALAEAINRAGVDAVKAALREQLESELKDSEEYAFVCRAVATMLLG